MSRILRIDPFPEIHGDIPSGCITVTPHSAAARALGVRKQTLIGLARSVLKTRNVHIASQLAATKILKATVRELAPNVSSSSFVARVKQILETILRTGVDIEALRANGSPRIGQVAQIAAEYRLRLRKQNLVDPVEVLWEASAVAKIPQQELYIYGYYRARKEEAFFINAIAAEGSIYILPCHDEVSFTINREWAGWFNDRGWEIDNRTSSNTQTTGARLASTFIGETPLFPDVKKEAFVYPDIESEVRGVLASTKQLIASGVRAGEIAIVCRDASVYGPIMADLSIEYGLPVKISYSVPLAETCFGNFLALLFEAIESEFAFESTARMLMHTLGPGIDPAMWSIARNGHISTAEKWLAASVDVSCLQWTESQTLKQWADCFRRSLKTFKVRRRAGERARELLAYNKLDEVLQEFVEADANRVTTREEFLAEVKEMLFAFTVPFSPATSGVELHEPNAILGASYRRIFVMGMAEGMLPGTVVDNPVIDFYERKRLIQFGIEFEGAAEVPRWESLSFYFLLLAAQEGITFSYPRTVANDLKIENSYFKKLGLTPEAAEGRGFISSVEEERRIYLGQPIEDSTDEVFATAFRQLTAEQGRESCEPFDEFDGVVGIPIDPRGRRWSVSQLTSLGQCAFRWFSSNLLKLKPLDEMELGLSASARGSFYHRVLEIAVRKAMGQPNIREASLLHLECAFADAEQDPKSGVKNSPNWALQRFEHLKVLRQAIESDEFIAPGATVLAVEQEYLGTWHGLSMKGYIDRVDQTPDGILAIDYKTSSTIPKGIKNEAGKTKTDLQLPVYVKVGLPELYPERPIAGGTYYSLAKGKSLSKVGPEYPAELEAFAEKVIHTLKTGNYAVDPDTDRNACEYCDFDSVCRQGHRHYRKRNGQ